MVEICTLCFRKLVALKKMWLVYIFQNWYDKLILWINFWIQIGMLSGPCNFLIQIGMLSGPCIGIPSFSGNCASWSETRQHINCTWWAYQGMVAQCVLNIYATTWKRKIICSVVWLSINHSNAFPLYASLVWQNRDVKIPQKFYKSELTLFLLVKSIKTKLVINHFIYQIC